MSKRKHPELAEPERTILNVIESRKENAIWVKDLKTEAKIPDQTFNKCLKNLLKLGLVKEVSHVQFKARKHYISAEFTPSNEITGGSWYLNGELDKTFIDELKDVCIKIINNQKVATEEGVYEFLKKRQVVKADFTCQQIGEILRSLVLDNRVIDVKSTGLGEYHSIPIGKLCYRFPPLGDVGQGLDSGAMMSIPCGVCPRIRECTPDGLISPKTCVYFDKWLDF